MSLAKGNDKIRHSWHLEAEGSNVCGGGSIPPEQAARSPSREAVCFDAQMKFVFFCGATAFLY